MFSYLDGYVSHHQKARRDTINIDLTKNELITPNGLDSFNQSYIYKNDGETNPQDVYARISAYFGSNPAHAQRVYGYLSNHWCMTATPISANGGTSRGRPISCNTNEIYDSRKSIAKVLLNENFWLATGGAGVGTYFGNIRSIGEKIKTGTTGGIFAFLPMLEALIRGSNQGSLRRSNAAVYLPVWHPEIKEFIKMRLQIQGGDPKRLCPGLHHGVILNKEFKNAVEKGLPYNLRSPKTGEVLKTIPAREIWYDILDARVEKGEPYLIFDEAVQEGRSDVYKFHDFYIKTSNLCTEITLKTGLDQHKKERTGVCCLSSLNLAYWHEWKDDPLFIPDMMELLDNVLSDYIEIRDPHIEPAIYAAYRERSVGLGVMGLHTLFQKKKIAFDSLPAMLYNKAIFKHIKYETKKASYNLALERGPCPDAQEAGLMERFANKTAIAPTASISVLAGEVSPGIEPIASNVFSRRTIAGNQSYLNPEMVKMLEGYGLNNPETLASIAKNKGSVQHLPISEQDKAVFKTAREIDQRYIVDMAADRQPYLCQGQSVNLFIPYGYSKLDLHKLHMRAWDKGNKSLYYLRAESAVNDTELEAFSIDKEEDDQECLACQ